jgi:predicted TPR repeat methyltransferase
MSSNFEQAREFFQRGISHYEAGRYAQAEREFAASLSLMPGRASTLTNLGATHLKLGRFQQAADLLGEALAQEPDNVEALAHRGTALAELARHGEALACAERALALQPGLTPAWALRGSLLKELGRLEEARGCFEKAISLGADTRLNRYYLASLSGQDVPATAPPEYVQTLFDSYADEFETHLQVLNYRAPEILAAELARSGRRFSHALDLGCGTGLCGLLLKPLADKLDGVDLSANMVDKARARQVYDEVAQDDLARFLGATARRYDLVLAADVFIYVGALEAVFAGAARAMQAGGVFCFSVESVPDDGPDYVLRPSLRYAHSPGYVRSLAARHGFEVARSSEHPIREDQRSPIPGLFVWLTKR